LPAQPAGSRPAAAARPGSPTVEDRQPTQPGGSQPFPETAQHDDLLAERGVRTPRRICGSQRGDCKFGGGQPDRDQAVANRRAGWPLGRALGAGSSGEPAAPVSPVSAARALSSRVAKSANPTPLLELMFER
jgi:hypothetical protein